jgi:hypothetical protein
MGSRAGGNEERAMPPARVALGFKPHTGWAVVVALTGTPDGPTILLRRRIALVPEDDSIPKHMYHAAQELGTIEGAKVVARATVACEKVAFDAVRAIVRDLRTQGKSVVCAGIATGSGKAPAELAAILRAHTLVHSAEGAFFVRMLAQACAALKLEVIAAREREVWDEAAAAWGLAPANLRSSIDGVRAVAGAPWSIDQKVASAVALLALRT